jgi:hypothetical protein
MQDLSEGRVSSVTASFDPRGGILWDVPQRLPVAVPSSGEARLRRVTWEQKCALP